MRVVKWIFGTVIGLFVLIFVLAAINGNSSQPGVVAAQQPSTDTTPQPATDTSGAPPPTGPAIPADEQTFANIVAQYASQYNAGANDMVKGAVRAQRRQAICQAFPGLHIENWVAQIGTLDATNSGKGVLGVTLNPNLTLSTSNNDFSDDIDHTAIPSGSPLFQKVSAMKVGDTVVFSGDFVQSDNDCFDETSITTDGGMQQPNFSFRFTDVNEAGAGGTP